MDEMQTAMRFGRSPGAAIALLSLIAFAPLHHAAAVTPMVASGAEHTVALKSDGTVLAFGGDSFGQLGRGRVVQSTKAVQARGLTDVQAIAVGEAFVVVLRTDGTVWAWGRNTFGQLGDGSRTSSSVPFQIRSVSGIRQVAAGVNHVLLLKDDGTVLTWGSNGSGQLGSGSTENKFIPIQVKGLTNVTDIAAGLEYSVALRGDGTVWTWGNNASGQLGVVAQDTCDGDPCSLVPVQVPGLTGITAITAGWGHTVVVDGEGKVWAWGVNGRGQLGDGTTTSRAEPVPITGLTGITAISAGLNHTLAIKSDASVLAWGANGSGQLGDGTATDSSSPVAVQGLIGVKAVSAGAGHSVALLSDGTLKAWGYNGFGQLGDGSKVNRRTPVSTQELGGEVTAVAAAAGNTVVLRADRTVWGWGSDGDGQLGAAPVSSYTVPGSVPGLTGVKAIAAGRSHVVGLKSDGNVWGAGVHYKAVQGISDATDASVSVAGRVPGLSDVTAIAAGDSHTVALKSDGSVWAWGWNGYGQLGDGTTNDGVDPVQVSGLPTIAMIAAGWYHNVAVGTDGSVWAWGDNSKGQLGVISTQICSNTLRFTGCAKTPRRVATLPPGAVTALAAGADHTLALSGGKVWAWGNNSAGQLGNGTTSSSSIPQAVSGLSDVTAITAQNRYSLALTDDGTVWAWGANYAGQLATGTTQNSAVPVQVQHLSDVISITAGDGHAMAVRHDGTVWGWGWNATGNLGDGTYSPRRTPVLVRNESAGGPLDLIPEVPNVIPADRIPRLLFAASKTGGRGATSLTVTLKGGSPEAAFASMGGFAEQTYNVYVAAYAPTLEGAGEPAWWQLDSSSVWTELTFPMAQYLSGAALGSQTTQVEIEILTNADLSQLADTVFYVGYGIDTDEMLAAGRYEEVFTASEPPTE
ncbi:MAG: hypothetical protein A3G25_17075 [Betaproteobacteria bacterium RIFCSPLOWO2_12_FULL_63_13]|nr:MAG: hypothetical protein A3G25_17075 [Betaproteobacteria bacterium RIFCSPLOWO2_12_FULL_63_13]